MSDSHKGKCFCGAVEVEVTGPPEGMGYCHCQSCRTWSAGPVNAFTLWKPDAVHITEGSEHVGTYQKTEADRYDVENDDLPEQHGIYSVYQDERR